MQEDENDDMDQDFEKPFKSKEYLLVSCDSQPSVNVPEIPRVTNL